MSQQHFGSVPSVCRCKPPHQISFVSLGVLCVVLCHPATQSGSPTHNQCQPGGGGAHHTEAHHTVPSNDTYFRHDRLTSAMSVDLAHRDEYNAEADHVHYPSTVVVWTSCLVKVVSTMDVVISHQAAAYWHCQFGNHHPVKTVFLMSGTCPCPGRSANKEMGSKGPSLPLHTSTTTVSQTVHCTNNLPLRQVRLATLALCCCHSVCQAGTASQHQPLGPKHQCSMICSNAA